MRPPRILNGFGNIAFALNVALLTNALIRIPRAGGTRGTKMPAIADNAKQFARARKRDINAIGLLGKANFSLLVVAHERANDNIALPPLEAVNRSEN